MKMKTMHWAMVGAVALLVVVVVRKDKKEAAK